ncbi:hypothetical protein FRC03_010554 [Tulasnella sp. 419]|nr:hypothetical protein FRC03_010554 [Tulasnella sp. 419]
MNTSINVDPQIKLDIAKRIRDACISVGFFYVKNHNVPDEVIDRTMDQAKRFFDLPLEEKMKIDIHKSKNFKGYTPLLGENTDPEHNAVGDLHEGFDIGWEERGATESSTGPMGGDNVWPELEGFKQPVMDYYYSVIQLGQTLFKLFALALDLSEDFFDDKTTKPAAIMRLLHYPPQEPKGAKQGADDQVMGIGAHTEPLTDVPVVSLWRQWTSYECFTILRQDANPALQVQNASGEWIHAKPIPGTFVIKYEFTTTNKARGLTWCGDAVSAISLPDGPVRKWQVR